MNTSDHPDNVGTLAALPEVLPIFPLPGALLLPGGHLPLNVFEPRYLNMIEYALGNGRIIGMIQPRKMTTETVPDTAELYSIGCAGRITSFSECEDGRFMVTLFGVCRFRVAREFAPELGFRRIQPEYQTPKNTSGADGGGGDAVEDRPRLLLAVRKFFDHHDIEADHEALDAADDQPLVTTLASVGPFTVEEKQALLECSGLTERAALLTTLMEFATLEPGTDTEPTAH